MRALSSEEIAGQLAACRERLQVLEAEVERLRARTAPTQISKPKLILGEGVEELLVFEALLDVMKLTDIQVLEYRGKRKLAAFLTALVKLPGFREVTSLGITRDADDNPAAAIDAIRSALERLEGSPLPIPVRAVEMTSG